MLVLDNVSKRYGNLEAVSNLSLHIKEGEFFGFLGPNGAGKTTTVRMLAGLARPTAGRVLVCGHDMARETIEAKRLIGLVPDRPFLYTRLRGEEFLNFAADLYGVDGAERRERIEHFLKLFRLRDWRHELIEAYSHGMRQKLVFAAALLHRPRALVVDEPLVGLDPEGITIVKRLMGEHCERGGTVFMSTHSLEVVEALCSRIGIIHHGKLIAEGTVAEVKALAKAPSPALESAFLTLTREEAD
ncbi:MAG: ABC transporter ATP-binding protein [Acidobacteriota bacterium]|nr:MAG: ABC transporter ATP-binding protein [Acidobacteriota bacterium]